MHIEDKSEAGRTRHGILLSSRFFTEDDQHTQTGQLRRIECEVGELIEFGVPLFAIADWSLTRKPPTSSVELRDGRFLANVAGVYVLQVCIEGFWTRALDLCAFTPLQMYERRKPLAEHRLRWRPWLNDPTRSREDIIFKLENT